MARKLFALFVVVLLVYVTSPLLLPVAMGAVFAVLLFPWMEALEKRRLSTSLASALLSVGMTLLLFVPAIILIFLGAKAGLEQVRGLKDAPVGRGADFFESIIASPVIQRLIEGASQWIPVDLAELGNAAEDLARGVALKIGGALSGLLTHLPSALMGLAIMVISTYFFLVDGRGVAALVRRHSIFDAQQTEKLIRSFAGTCRSVILATVVSGFVQAIVFTLAYVGIGGGNVALIGFLVFLASFIPVVGSAPVTFGATLHQFLLGNRGAALALLIISIVVSTIDNVIRPAVLKGSANLHPLLAFVAVFGGLQMIGFSGVFLGPIIAALTVATVKAVLEGPEAAIPPAQARKAAEAAAAQQPNPGDSGDSGQSGGGA